MALPIISARLGRWPSFHRQDGHGRRRGIGIILMRAVACVYLAPHLGFVATSCLGHRSLSQSRVLRAATQSPDPPPAKSNSSDKAQAKSNNTDLVNDPVVEVSEPLGPGVGRQWQAAPGPMTDGTVASLKSRLLRLCAAGNRGFSAIDSEKNAVLAIVEELEDAFEPPSGEALRQEALEGSWSLIYTTSPDLDSLDRLPLPFWRTARVGQSFGPGEAATNEIEFVSPLGSRVNQTVQCSWNVREPDAKDFMVSLTFEGSSTKLAKVAGLDLPVELPPLSFPLPPGTGVFRIGYLDDGLLVQRTRAGPRLGINVLVRDQ